MATSPHNQAEAPAQDAPVRKKDRTHWLYIMVIAAVFAGAAIGLITPEAEIGRAHV